MFCRSFWRFFTILHNWFNSLSSLIVLPCIVRKESNNSMVSLLYLTCKCATACFIFSVLSHFQSALELLCLWIWGVLYVVYYSTYNGCRLLYKFPATFKTKFSLIIKTIDQCTLAVTEKNPNYFMSLHLVSGVCLSREVYTCNTWGIKYNSPSNIQVLTHHNIKRI